MNVYFYRYGSICEPDMISAFEMAGLNVIEEKAEMTRKELTPTQRLEIVESALKNNDFLFAFSINFFPIISDVCNIYGVKYLAWTVDSPVLELFTKSITNPVNRVFCFDRAQYKDVSRFNPECVFHLPLAAANERFGKVIETVSESDVQKFGGDISFVGSLYYEKDPVAMTVGLSEYAEGFISGITESSLKIFGYYPGRDAITPEVVKDIRKAVGRSFFDEMPMVADIENYAISHNYIAYHIAAVERERTLNELAKHFNVELFTNSDTSRLKGVHVHKGVKTLDEMPKVFNLSRINLNMTLKSIEEGLPLRVFDILGCGGFVMTNYQAELSDYFEIGVDIEAYSSIEELIDKCDYYLKHEDERAQIAQNGYAKALSFHGYFHRMKEMLSKV